jgi:pimeloyl-ACP methyl ester carboxylesterase
MSVSIRGGGLALAVLVGLGLAGGAEAQHRPARRPDHVRPPRVVVVPVVVPPSLAMRAGYNARVRVLLGSRLGPTFATSADVLAATPRTALLDYLSNRQHYQLFVPPTYRANQPHALIVLVSASGTPGEWARFEPLCRKYGVVFASPYDAGDDCAPGRRLRIALDVLEDVRQRLNVDTDRIYLAGFAGGARIASDIAFSYPEFIGGLLAIGGAGGLREEPWLRDRVAERLSVALACGELSPARSLVERWRFPPLRDAGVRAKLWLSPLLGQAVPPAGTLEQMLLWLEAGRLQRRALGGRYPPARMAEGSVPAPQTWAAGVVEEARKRLADRKKRESGLMQLEGVTRRWKDTPAAEQAARLVKEHADWRKVHARRQAEHAYLEAKALDAYLANPRALVDVLSQPALWQLAVRRWEEVDRHGPDTPEGKEARKRLTELRKLVPLR